MLSRRRGPHVYDAGAGTYLSSRAQLNKAKFAAGPGARKRGDDERERVPVGSKGWTAIPRRDCANDADDKADNTAYKRVQHRPIGREPRDEIAARDAVDHTVRRRKQQGAVEADHRLAPWRKDAGNMQQLVCAKSERDTIPTTMPASTAPMLRSAWR
jgi:hypothetical protein